MENIAPDYLIPILSHIAGQTIIRDKTLIVFDEVQLCERAKFSFPVGKVDIKNLYPMDVEEFMLALKEDSLAARIRECFENNTPMPSALHNAGIRDTVCPDERLYSGAPYPGHDSGQLFKRYEQIQSSQ